MRVVFLIGLLAVLASCSDDSSTSLSEPFDDQEILDNYVDNVVVAKYAMLNVRAKALDASVETLIGDQSAANLLAAQEAWRSARQVWELCETSLFGPVDSNGYDPAMDSWPINLTDVKGVLASQTEINQTFFETIAPESRGFHVIELFLFGEDGQRDPSFTEREGQYLRAATTDLDATTEALHNSWIAGDKPFGLTFKQAGQNSAYPSRSAAAQEIVTGIIVILDEVANGKIADPYDERDVTLVESPFSFNSLLDFHNNVLGAKEAYTGDFTEGGKTGVGLSDWVEKKDSALNQRVLAEFDLALEAIEAIPAPFRTAILDDASRVKIQAAVDAINTVRVSCEGSVISLITASN